MSLETDTGATRIVAAGRAVSCEIGDEIMVLNSDTGVYYSLDGTGLQIWKALEAPCTLAELCDLLLDEYDVDAGQCESEVRALIAHLSAEGLVEIRTA